MRGLYSESVRIKWACAYTSVVLLTIIWSKRNKGGKHQFSSARLTHSCTLGGRCTAARAQLCSRSKLASDVAGVGTLCKHSRDAHRSRAAVMQLIISWIMHAVKLEQLKPINILFNIEAILNWRNHVGFRSTKLTTGMSRQLVDGLVKKTKKTNNNKQII